MSTRGATGVVYRAANRNSNGDMVDESGKVVRSIPPLGTITGIILGGLSASLSMQRQDSSDTSGQIGIPLRKKFNPNAIAIKYGDRLVIDGTTFRVTSAPRWTQQNVKTGTKPEYTWVEVEGTVGV